MRGTKFLHMPFEFNFSEGGTFKKDTGITVCAPSLDQFTVHNTMVAFASEAMKKLNQDQALTFAAMGPALDIIMKNRAEFQKQAEEEDAEAAKVVEAETEADMAERVMGVYASGLGDRFPAFMDYLKKTLTNNAKLARVGDTKIPIKDETWGDLAEKGGMEAINIVLAGFAGFFLKGTAAPRSQEKAGSNSRPTSPSEAAVH